MVIKSKNSRKVKIIKIIAVILAMISGGIALFSTVFMWNAWHEWGDTILYKPERHQPQAFMTSDPAGYRMLDSVADVRGILQDYKNEDYFQNVYLKQERANLEQEREAYINDQIGAYGVESDWYEYHEETTGYFTEPTTYEPASAANGDWITETSAPYHENEPDDYQAKYEKARAHWLQEFNLEGKLHEAEKSVRDQLDRLNDMADLKIYAVSNDDGTIYTNVTDKNAAAKIQALPYALHYRGASQEVEQLNGPVNDILQSILEYNFPAQNIDVYLGLDTENLTQNIVGSYYTDYENYNLCAEMMDIAVWLLPVAAVLFVLSWSLSMALAGNGPLPETGTEEYRRKVKRFGGTITGREPVLHNILDAIPNDLHFILSIGLMALLGYLTLYTIQIETSAYTWAYTVAALCSASISMLLVELCMSISRNAKAGHYWQRTLLASMGRGFKRLGKWFKYQFSPLGHHFKSLPRYILRLLIAYFVVMIPLSLIPFLPIFLNIFVVLFLWRSMASLDRLMKYAHEIQSGNLNVTIDTAKFPKWMVPFAQDIIHLRDGMQAAVDEALKSERLKTELITNVSHDLKTPLTSIINYTGLLAKCDIPDQQAQDYIAVLQNKSDRLKHLIEDLVEASKASTGNIEFHPVRLNLYEMAVQAVGENEDALANQGVTVVINEPEQQPVVQADGQKTWRVVENLLSNVRKYSVPGTRAYIDVRTEGSFGVLTVKNISREELNISPEELMERFVRGDESRSTEGSGLGLSIAQNLCEKQGGRFTIEIDGDLFKATVRLPLAPEQPTMPAPIQTSPDPAQS